MTDPFLKELVQKVQEGMIYNPKFVLKNGILLYKKKGCILESFS